MGEEIKPAMAPEQWEVVKHYCPPGPHGVTGGAQNCGTIGDNRHALAALALHGQPFGFTQEDLTWLRIAAADVRKLANLPESMGIEWPRSAGTQWLVLAEHLESIAARIAALLPPNV